MRLFSARYRKKYSARGLAAGAVFCPSCSKKLDDRYSAFCPACGFTGEHTLSLFPIHPPPLETISDHAKLFTAHDRILIRRAFDGIRRQFPQLHWKVVTASLKQEENLGLFAFWLMNVSPSGSKEEPGSRPWTNLLVILADGRVAVAPGYSAEVWLSGHDWSRLLGEFIIAVRRRGHGVAIRHLMKNAAKALDKSWVKARSQVRKSRSRRPIPSTRYA